MRTGVPAGGWLTRADNVYMWDWNIATGDIYRSPTYTMLLGYEDAELANQREGWFAFIHPDDLPQVKAQVQNCISGNSSYYELEHRMLHKEGDLRWVLARGVVVRGNNDVALRMIGIDMDITAYKQETALGSSNECAALEEPFSEIQKLENLGVMVGGIAHDFKNLLAPILNCAELALLNLKPGLEAHTYVQHIATAARRAAELTHQLLVYAGTSKPTFACVDMNRIVEEMLLLLQVSIARHVTLQYQLTSPAPLIVADAVQLRQVLMNLVINGAEAIAERPGQVSVVTGTVYATRPYLDSFYLNKELPEGTYAFLEVSDTGQGIDAAVVTNICDPFFTTKPSGYGLGLASVQCIVHNHGGALRVQSALGSGTTFTVLFPLAADSKQCYGNPPVTYNNAGLSADTNRHMQGTVLIIDDEEGVRRVTTMTLERLGFTAMASGDGQAGIALFRQHAESISCVMLDMNMPRMSGERVLREIQHIKPDVRVLLMSGYTEEEVQGLIDSERVAFLPKPFTLSQLRAKLQQVLIAPDPQLPPTAAL